MESRWANGRHPLAVRPFLLAAHRLCIDVYWLALVSIGRHQSLASFTEFFFIFFVFFWLFMRLCTFVNFDCSLPGFTGFYWVLLGFTGFYWVLLGFTGFYWV